jgi:predicted nuclease of restriction endonuclease-like (RecB) superfamily
MSKVHDEHPGPPLAQEHQQFLTKQDQGQVGLSFCISHCGPKNKNKTKPNQKKKKKKTTKKNWIRERNVLEFLFFEDQRTLVMSDSF